MCANPLKRQIQEFDAYPELQAISQFWVNEWNIWILAFRWFVDMCANPLKRRIQEFDAYPW
jgi:hypothetical protein